VNCTLKYAAGRASRRARRDLYAARSRDRDRDASVCAHPGAIHSVVFGGFSATSRKDRIADGGAKLLITADGGWRGGRTIELKAAADQPLASRCRTIERVIVDRRTAEPVPMDAKRDVWWHEVVAGQSPICAPEPVAAQHPLFLLYKSGSRAQ
jgi:acetyl-CoA synthetase